MDFRSPDGVFGYFLVNFGRFGILENADFLMLKIHFGIIKNLSVMIEGVPGSCFHVLAPDQTLYEKRDTGLFRDPGHLEQKGK